MRYDVLFLPLLFPEPFRSSSYTPPTYLSQAQIFISEGSSGAPSFLSNCAFCVCASTMSSVALGRPSTALPRVLLKRPGARTRTFVASAPWGKQRLVMLGSGWGGYEVLRSVDKKRWGTFIPSENTYIEVQADHVYIFVQMSLLSLLHPTSTSLHFWQAVPLALLNSDPQ